MNLATVILIKLLLTFRSGGDTPTTFAVYLMFVPRSDSHADATTAIMISARRILRLWGCCLLWALAFAAASWLVMTSYVLATDIASQQDALRAAGTLYLQGRPLAPVHEADTLRGDRNADYWCFTDGLCFYSVDRFRSLYPTYNDLDEDDLLVAELHQEAGAPADVFNRKMDWRPILPDLRAMIAPLCLLAVAIYSLTRFNISSRPSDRRRYAR